MRIYLLRYIYSPSASLEDKKHKSHNPHNSQQPFLFSKPWFVPFSLQIIPEAIKPVLPSSSTQNSGHPASHKL